MRRAGPVPIWEFEMTNHGQHSEQTQGTVPLTGDELVAVIGNARPTSTLPIYAWSVIWALWLLFLLFMVVQR